MCALLLRLEKHGSASLFGNNYPFIHKIFSSMKNYTRLFTLVLCLAGSTLFAQTQQGSIMIGGNAGFQSNDGGSLIFVQPALGFFVIDQLAVGGSIGFSSYSPELGESTTGIGIGPFVRYYFMGEGKARVFAQGNFAWNSTKTGDLDAVTSTTFGGGAGVDIFLNDHVAIEGFAGYSSESRGGASQGTFGISFGVQAFIGGN